MRRITKDNYNNIVYVSHAYGGDEKNLREIEAIIKLLHKKYPTYLFVSPVHAFGHMYNYVGYDKGLSYALLLLDTLADEMWYCPDDESKGVAAEIEYCKKYNIPFRTVEDMLR